MLARLAPYLWRAPVVVSAEQTSLWLPRLLPLSRPLRQHLARRRLDERARRSAPPRRARRCWCRASASGATYLARGIPPDKIVVTGYVKAEFRHRTAPRRWFADERPIILYTPHWQRHRSSWWAWGRGGGRPARRAAALQHHPRAAPAAGREGARGRRSLAAAARPPACPCRLVELRDGRRQLYRRRRHLSRRHVEPGRRIYGAPAPVRFPERASDRLAGSRRSCLLGRRRSRRCAGRSLAGDRSRAGAASPICRVPARFRRGRAGPLDGKAAARAAQAVLDALQP